MRLLERTQRNYNLFIIDHKIKSVKLENLVLTIILEGNYNLHKIIFRIDHNSTLNKEITDFSYNETAIINEKITKFELISTVIRSAFCTILTDLRIYLPTTTLYCKWVSSSPLINPYCGVNLYHDDIKLGEMPDVMGGIPI